MSKNMSKKRTLEDTGIDKNESESIKATKKAKTNDEANAKSKTSSPSRTVPLSSLTVSPQQTEEQNKASKNDKTTFDHTNGTTKDNSNSTTNNNSNNVIPDAFASYSNDGSLGFQKLLKNKSKTNSPDATTNSKDKESKKTSPGFSWNSSWGNKQKDGSLSLEFNYGTWGNVDLSSSAKIGWESQAAEYNENYEPDEPVAQLNGAVDTGDSNDETEFSAQSKIYTLENGKYNEKGIGILKVNTYKKNENDKGARILCRRELVKTTLINASILKGMKFEAVSGKFVRFVCVEKNDEEDDGNNVIEKEKEKDDEINNNKKNKNNDDDDIETKMVTYLIKPSDSTNVQSLIDVIHKLQSEL